MHFRTNPRLAAVEAPPIAEAMTWLPDGPRPRPLINLCQAVPGYAPAPELQTEIARLSGLESTGLYSDILGTPELRQALARHMAADYRGTVAAEQVAITAGCNQAYCVALLALCAQGDNVIIPAPWYFNHQMWQDTLGIETRAIPGITASGMFPDVADAAALIDGRTRAIVLCTPNNPTGAIYPPQVLDAFFDLCRARGIALVIDETYKDFRETAGPVHRLFQRAGWDGTFIQLYSFSKSLAITGYRVGSLIASAAFLAEAEKAMDCIAICAPRISQGAVAYGLQHLTAWTRNKTALMAERKAALEQAFARADLRHRLKSCGAFFAYVEHPFGAVPAKQVAMRLAREQDLLCLPGSMFGPGQERYLRLAFANVEAGLMPDIAERLVESQRAPPG